MMRTLHPVALAGVALLVAACGPSHNLALEDAQRALDEARAESIAQRAPIPFQEAEQAVVRAERALDEGEDEVEVTHLAGVAEQRVEIARVEARARADQARAEELARSRSDVLLEARNDEVERLRRELDARQSDRGLVVTLPDVLFDVDRATLKPGAEVALTRVAEFLRASPERGVRIEGHTDSTGGDAYNQSLSEARAQAVATRLRTLGVSSERLEVVGLGETLPIASNATAAGRQENRRVEIVIENPAAAASQAAPAAAER